MATWKNERTYRCFEDCRQAGCPSHVLRVEIQTTADVLTVYNDKEVLFSMNPTQWKELTDILREWDYTFFPVKP